MKSLSELKDYYRRGLSRELQQFEQRRKGVILTLLVLLGIIISADVWLIMRIMQQGDARWVIGIIVGLILFIVAAAVLTTRFCRDFKREIIGKMIQFMDDGLVYDPKGYIEKTHFDRCRLYECSRYNRYSGEDLVSGTLDGRHISFCELNVQHHSGGKNSSTTTIFRGLFLVADAGCTFQGATVLLPRKPEMQLPTGKLGNLVRGLIEKYLPKPTGVEVELDDPAFGQHFTVYADDEAAGRELLDATLRERILALRPSKEAPLRIAFCDGCLFVSFGSRRNMFEPRLFKTVLDYRLVQEFFEDFTKVCALVAAVSPNPEVPSIAP